MKRYGTAMVAALTGLAPIAGRASSVGLSVSQTVPLIVHAATQPMRMTQTQMVSRKNNPPVRANQEKGVTKGNTVGARMHQLTSVTVHTSQQNGSAVSFGTPASLALDWMPPDHNAYPTFSPWSGKGSGN